MRRLIAMPLALATGLIFAIGLAAPASAHTSLVGIDPAEGSTVAAGDTVTLDFSEALLTIGAEATVTDSAGAATKLDVTFPKPTSAQVVLPAMAGGNLTLAWRVVAGDGHPVEGKLAYVADAAPQTPASASSATSSSVPNPTASADASATPIVAIASAAPSTPTGGSSGPNLAAVALAIGAALLVTIAAIVSAKRRR